MGPADSAWWQRLARIDRPRAVERRLRRERPQPSDDFVDRTEARLRHSAMSVLDRHRMRLRAAILIAAGIVLAIAAFAIAAS